MKQQGPQNIIIPEQKFNACNGCEFNYRRMVKSGFNPIYSNTCKHPKIMDSRDADDIKFMGIQTNGVQLTEQKNGFTVTPAWCPILINEPKRDKYDELIKIIKDSEKDSNTISFTYSDRDIHYPLIEELLEKLKKDDTLFVDTWWYSKSSHIRITGNIMYCDVTIKRKIC